MTLTYQQAFDLPFKEAADFFRQKARVSTEHWTDVWRTAHSHSFMVAGAASDALLSDFQSAIQKALDKGTTLAELRKDFDTIVAKHGWSHNGSPGWRARIIYETNLSTAYSAGRYAQMTEPDTLAVYPYWRYVHSGSSHPRLQHLAWDGLTLRADDPFWASHFPPNGWHCGCRVDPITERGLRRMGKSEPDTAPPIVTRRWRNPHTGAMHDVPAGIDPDFDYNPGMAWKQGGHGIPVKSPDLTPAPVIGAPPLASPAKIKQWVEDVTEHAGGGRPALAPRISRTVTVGQVPPEVQKLLGGHADGVQISHETMLKQLGSHPDLVAEDYTVLPTLLSQPVAVLDNEEGRLRLVLRLEDQAYSAVVKATRDQRENYVLSFHKARGRTIRAWARKVQVLLGSLESLMDLK